MKLKTKPMPLHLEKRQIKTFLWIPKHLNNEWRWLETAYIEQKYYRRRFDWGWKSINWLNY